jgi:hypothetical protein
VRKQYFGPGSARFYIKMAFLILGSSFWFECEAGFGSSMSNFARELFFGGGGGGGNILH